MILWQVLTDDGTPFAVKAACTVWRGGKAGDNIKGLPITYYSTEENGGAHY